MKEIILVGDFKFKYVAKVGPKRAGNWRVPVEIELHIEAEKFPHAPRVQNINFVSPLENGKLDYQKKNSCIELSFCLYASEIISDKIFACERGFGFYYYRILDSLVVIKDIVVKKSFFIDHKDVTEMIEALKALPKLIAQQLQDGADIPAMDQIVIRTE